MRKRNQLVQRGSITFIVDPKIFKVRKTKGMGRPRIFSDPLIMMLMMIKIQHRLAYRTLQGFAESLMTISKQSLSIPTYSAICKRARKSKRPSVVAIDASGVKIYGEREWKVKIHVAMDPKTGEIIAEKTSLSNMHDGKALDSLLDQVPKSVKQVLADGAYDGRASREVISKRGARASIPPPKNAWIHNKDRDRDDAIRIIRSLGRSLWGKLVGYSQRSLVEAVFSRMKRLFGSRLFSKRFDAQKIENKLRCLLLNTNPIK